MAELTLAGIEPTHLTPHQVEWGDQHARNGEERRRRKRDRAERGALLPDGDQERYAIDVELADGQVVALLVRDRATGDVVSRLTGEALARRAESDGLLFERSA